jgi:V8-like Glu-specific endopeptidase
MHPHFPRRIVAPFLRLFRVLPILPLVGALACGAAPQAPDEDPTSPLSRSTEIVGGTADNGDPAVIEIEARWPRSYPPDGLYEVCTAVVVAPTVVVTAAHCTIPTGESAPPVQTRFRIFLKNDEARMKDADWTVVPTANVHPHPRYTVNADGTTINDIAVVVLPRPLAVRPLPLHFQPLTAALVGQPIRLVGYGYDANWQAGRKRSVKTVLTAVGDTTVQAGTLGASACMGDSGGPGLMVFTGVEQVVSLESYGQGACTSASTQTRVDAFADFVRPFLRSH